VNLFPGSYPTPKGTVQFLGSITDTPEPTQVPPTVTPIVATDVIVETAKIIDAPVQQVEKMLGNSIETFSWGIGEVEEIPDGGEARTYQVGKYKVWVNYDKEV